MYAALLLMGSRVDSASVVTRSTVFDHASYQLCESPSVMSFTVSRISPVSAPPDGMYPVIRSVSK